MGRWEKFSHPNLPIELKYPDPTPRGHPVVTHERKTETSCRVHLVSEVSDEIYFEVGQYRNLLIQQAIEMFLADVTERIDQLESSQVLEIPVAGLPAYQFSIYWPGKEREILFIERAGVLYRIIHDPLSPINKMILKSFKFI